jgi:hypothetical protein
MDQMAIEARREYFRNYAKANKEKLKETQRKWREKPENKEKLKEYQKNYWSKKAMELIK